MKPKSVKIKRMVILLSLFAAANPTVAAESALPDPKPGKRYFVRCHGVSIKAEVRLRNFPGRRARFYPLDGEQVPLAIEREALSGFVNGRQTLFRLLLRGRIDATGEVGERGKREKGKGKRVLA